MFGLQVFLDDRKGATRLLDDLNRSCLVKGFRRHSTYLPLYALAGLYGRDLRLPSARFRWLKGVDRTLWYALHSADTLKVFVEGSGVLAQARAENRAQALSLPCDGLMVQKAVEGLYSELESIGLIHQHESAPEVAVQAEAVPLLQAIYSAEPQQPEP